MVVAAPGAAPLPGWLNSPVAAARRSVDGPDELSRLLVALRGELTQAEAAALVGLTQSKVSRAERSSFPLDLDETERYASALGAVPDVRERLSQLAAEKVAERERIAGRTTLVRSATAIQSRIGRLERAAGLVRSWQPAIVPGVLQTSGYTAALAGDVDPAWWVARRERLALLDEPHRMWHQVVSEAVLRWGLGSREIMAEQIQHLIEISDRPNVRFGIVPLDTVHAVAAPAAFHLFDDVACDATQLGTSFVDDPSDAAHYRQLFDRLDTIALYDDAARAVLVRAGRVRRWTV